jgi:cell division protein FtsN
MAPVRTAPVPAAELPPVAKTAPAPPSGAAALPPQASTGRWTVYASPSRDRLAIEHERAALRAKGYPAEVVTLRRDGDTWYRIRVGRYATQAQADEASRRLRTDGVGHAFVQSE